ncbi:FAD-binding oxidoreductase [Arenimonas sp. MALMAid1274]|uniref:FAD-binding oxidoreductase n=1 Tax=Arenimonas sp. MALMAid1274 TaxID=3411630 RepID=UPI003B9ED5E2
MAGRRGPLPPAGTPLLAYGQGRSYGDSCLNSDGRLLLMRGLDRFLRFDADTGVLACEAGVTLGEVLALALPRGWFLAVTPGTRLATVGGAIANDVHGKNHHRNGSFGDHVRGFELLRSDGSRQWLAPGDARFAATVGGLGLTGAITWAELQLQRVSGPWMQVQSLKFDGLDEFFALSTESAESHEYTVAWVDCLAKGAALGRGHFLRANHAAPGASGQAPGAGLAMPLTPPLSLVNRLTLRPFNTLYYHRQRARRREGVQHYAPYFYPLDGIHDWNRMYGPAGFLQHQCVLPPAQAREAVRALLGEIARSGQGSFLAVLKEFGDRPAPGLMSFARPGTTLALDFPNTGAPVFALLDRLDAIVAEAGGALYPAKDARMSPAMFRAGQPGLPAFLPHIDPAFSSSFWRRVME